MAQIEVLLISEETLKSTTIIGDNLESSYLQDAIKKSQELDLEPILGSKLFQRLKDMVADGSITGQTDYYELLTEKIEPYLCCQVVSRLLPLVYAKIRNNGVVQPNSERYSSVSQNEMLSIKADNQHDANEYSLRLSRYLIANKKKFPEYMSSDSCADILSNPNAFNKTIYLGLGQELKRWREGYGFK